MTHKPKRLVGLTIIVALAFALFIATIQRPVYSSPGDAWADPTCRYRIKMAFRNSASSTNLKDFPVLVVLNSSVDYYLYSRTSATDIRFYDGSTLLPKDTELWNSAGNSYIWVKVPQIDAGSSDYIYAYYGCSGAVNPDSPGSVWPADQFVMVLHLNQTGTNNRIDATLNGNNGVPINVVHRASGRSDGSDEFNGSTAYMTVASAGVNMGTGNFTYSFWFNSSKWGTQYPFDKKGGAAGDAVKGYKMTIADPDATGLSASIGDGTFRTRVNTGADAARGLRNGRKWAMFTCVVNRKAQTMTVYVNGTFTAYNTDPSGFNNPGDISSVGNVNSDYDLFLGVRPEKSGNWFQGQLDEVRISNVVRSADWIKADYLSTRNSFIAFGSAETLKTIDSCDSGGVKKDNFVLSDTVYVKGTGYAASTNYPLYVLSDTTWNDGMNIPTTRVPGTATSVTSDSNGNIPTTSVWSPTLTQGKYDMVVDVDKDGVYDQGLDALDDKQVQVSAGFFVIPEYAVGTILALAMCFGGVFVYRRYKHNKLKPF